MDMLKNNYVSPRSAELEMDACSAILSGSLQDYEVDDFDYSQMAFTQRFTSLL